MQQVISRILVVPFQRIRAPAPHPVFYFGPPISSSFSLNTLFFSGLGAPVFVQLGLINGLFADISSSLSFPMVAVGGRNGSLALSV